MMSAASARRHGLRAGARASARDGIRTRNRTNVGARRDAGLAPPARRRSFMQPQNDEHQPDSNSPPAAPPPASEPQPSGQPQPPTPHGYGTEQGAPRGPEQPANDETRAIPPISQQQQPPAGFGEPQ